MLRRLLNLFRPNRLEADLHEEIEFHRSQTSGVFGNATLVQDRMRDASTVAWLETIIQDLRYGLRQLSKAPVLVAVAVLSLALGIGANTAIFTLINAVMLQSLPVKDPGRLVLFYGGFSTGITSGGNEYPGDIFSYPSFQYFQSRLDPFEDLCAFRQGTDYVVMHVSRADDSGPREPGQVHLVSGNYFRVLGVRAAAGRVLSSADDAPSAAPVAVMSYSLWRGRFNGDASAVGKTIILNGTAFQIVGVAAREFFGERIQTAPDLWLPLRFQPQVLKTESLLTARDSYWLNFMGRLRPGVSMQTAEAASNLHLQQFYLEQAGAHPSPDILKKIHDAHIELKPGGSGISGLRYLYSKPLHVLLAVVFVVLLIACANIATLLLARASARRQEFLSRLALGASRGRLLRQVLTESVLLSVIGGAAGTVFAWWGVKMLVVLLHIDPVVKVKPDAAVLAFTFLLSILTGVLFGIFPALKFSRMEPRLGSIVKSAGWRSRRIGSTQALIMLQVALSLILLLGAGLLAHSLMAMERQDIGFNRDNILIVRTDASLAGYQSSELFALYRELGERLSQLPGVISATVTRFTPESGSSSSGNFSMRGHTLNDAKDRLFKLEVGPRFFETLGIPLLLGRTIGPRDTPASPSVAVVNETFVKLYLPNQNPIGQHIMMGSPFKEPGAEIVGVVKASKYYDLREEPKPMAFFSLPQHPVPGFEMVLRTSTPPAGITPEVRRMLKQVSSKLPVLDVSTLDHQIENSLDQQKMITTLCSIFGVLALILAAVGIYGTLAYSVAGRTAEIGIRMAVGAQRHSVIWLVLRDSIGLTIAGVVLGLPLALTGTRWIKSFLFGVPATDPLAIAGAVLLIVALALLAGYLPARRAAKIDPMRALRHE